MNWRVSGTLSEIWCVNRRHEVFFGVEPGDALGEEERSCEDAALVAQLGDGLHNGGLAGTSWPIKPQHAAVTLFHRKPCVDHRQYGVLCARLEFGGIIHVPRVVEGARCNASL